MGKTIFLICFAACFFLTTKQALAQSFSFSPGTATQKVAENFTVDIKIDVGTLQVQGADLKITYDSSAIEIVTVEIGDFFPMGGFNPSDGSVYMSYGIDENLELKDGSGVYARMTLKGKKAGEAVLTVVCSSQVTDSNIWGEAESDVDVINCAEITNPKYTFTSTLIPGSPTITPLPLVPTITGVSAITVTPAPPVSGSILPTILFVGLGVLLTIFGLILR